MLRQLALLCTVFEISVVQKVSRETKHNPTACGPSF